MNKIFKCHIIVHNAGKMKNITAGKKYTIIHNYNDRPNIGKFDKILNDRKEWVVPIALTVKYCTTKGKLIKDITFFKKGDDVRVFLSSDKKTFLYYGEIYNTKEYLLLY